MFLLLGMELLQLKQNENKVTLVVHQLKMTCLSETKGYYCTTYTRLTITEEPNSDPLFQPENV